MIDFDLPEVIVAEMVAVGAIPQDPRSAGAWLEPGVRFSLNGQPCIIVRELTPEEFMERVVAAGLAGRFGHWGDAPAGVRYFQFSTD